MQTKLPIASNEEIKNSWAFAATRQWDHRLARTRNTAVITAVSKEARSLGIQAGMRVHDARQLLPELRILIYRGGRYDRQRA